MECGYHDKLRVSKAELSDLFFEGNTKDTIQANSFWKVSERSLNR